MGIGYSPERSAIWAIVITVLTSFLSKDRREWLLPRQLFDATVEGAKNMLPVAGLLAAAGMIVGTFSLTGLGLKISSLIMSLSGGSIIMALFWAMVASFVIGLSLPITATYIMTVVMVAPALVTVGVPMHVAHLLAFYFAVLSEVSPPVGLSPSAAAAVTGGNPFGAMMQSWKYCLPAFLVPFLFSATATGANLLIVEAAPSGGETARGGDVAAAGKSCSSFLTRRCQHAHQDQSEIHPQEKCACNGHPGPGHGVNPPLMKVENATGRGTTSRDIAYDVPSGFLSVCQSGVRGGAIQRLVDTEEKGRITR